MNLRDRVVEEPEVNLTSLIDVVLLLLVFFMVSTSFTRESEIKLVLPQSLETAPVETTGLPAIEIAVTADGAYIVDQQPLLNNRPDTLRRALVRLYGDNRDNPVTIRADARASHQSVVSALDVAGRLGFVRINIATINDATAQ